MSAAGGGDGHDSGDADGVPAKGSGSLKAPVATTLFVTFGFLGFGTGWSSQDSIFQQVNKYTAEYDDLTFAGELVLLSNLAAAITLALTFSGLYLAPGGVELRTVRFFEATITSVLAASCGVQITMATSWNVSKRVVEACALVAGVIGDLQAFIVYPFFNAFYRTELIAFMNLGETVASLFSGALALIQSPTTGVEYFSVGAYFGVIFVGTVFAALAWMSLSYRRGYRRHDDGDNGASPTDSATETEDEGGEGEERGWVRPRTARRTIPSIRSSVDRVWTVCRTTAPCSWRAISAGWATASPSRTRRRIGQRRDREPRGVGLARA